MTKNGRCDDRYIVDSPDQDCTINILRDDVSPPSSSTLLDLSNLPPSSSAEERQSRLARLKSWCIHFPETIIELFTSSNHRDKKTGCMPLHWMAGTGFDEAIDFIFDQGKNNQFELYLYVTVDQHAHHPSTHRTPLHYSARNGHLSTCRLLVEQYGANLHPKCGRGEVTPLQLAVWQNNIRIVQYLVEKNGTHVIHERNGFNCGLMHWIGLVPKKRWKDNKNQDKGDGTNEKHDDGSGVLPLARYLHSMGIVYESTPENSNTQGHTPNHKAAWGGNLSLLQYFRDEHGVYDVVQDGAGNYCADIAKMRGNTVCHQWLLEHGSGDRAESYRVLGLDVNADMEAVRSRYMELARTSHPDKILSKSDGADEKKEEAIDDFVRIKAAYEHLTKEGGVGRQKNPKFDELKLLENHRRIEDTLGGSSVRHDEDNDDGMFLSRLIAVLSDYGDDGFPVSLIARRWNQIWPDRPFPKEYVITRTVKCSKADGDGSGVMVLRKKVKLLKWLKWRCKNSGIYFRNIDGDVLAFEYKEMEEKGGCQAPS
mmetsp:Transcript_44338/g.93129  ORF Transcript_44338/g.93129 Transcript_44338/m.93129 type:complete len:538 (-) Transcript_44338:253-1866(-)|eukprot:CAMPEP_0183741176 /NCGR_PEP_ID=MMETSP0737-20130205/61471_1 /TAXON_ID=385413 /ORGANISM="Thalassiosira miniscula, Strain CCMP1093" /LENGTH=537 /DNA_ID=CAMNT_0025976431 /DNA_START=87 /DNA_END=1700 /DNA_ORIENTATION=+